MRILFYLFVLTILAPVVVLLSMLQASIIRMERELKRLKLEYQFQVSRLMDENN